MYGLTLVQVYVVLINLVFISLSGAASIDDQTALQASLLSGYNANVRPNSSVQVPITFALKNLIELMKKGRVNASDGAVSKLQNIGAFGIGPRRDIVNEYMIVSGSLLVQWHDYRLIWNISDYNGVSSVYFKVDEIWRPLLVLSNAADAIYAIGDNSDQRSIPIITLFNGGLFWVAPAFFKSICSIDVSLFPFDTQKCELVISSWMFDKNDMEFLNNIPYVSLNQYEENGEYHLSRTYVEIRDIITYGQTAWSYAVFGLEFQRRYSYYVINMVLPVLFLEVLGVLVFALPATSGEKLAYSLTLLLSLVVMVSIVSEKIPSTSLQVPLLSIFVLEGVALSVMEVLLVVYVLNLRYWHESGKPLGRGHKMAANLMIKRFCHKNKVDRSEDEVVEINISNNEKNINKKVAMTTDIRDATMTTDNTSAFMTTDTSHDEEKCTYEDLAQFIERLCFWIFTILMLAFVLQAIIAIHMH